MSRATGLENGPKPRDEKGVLGPYTKCNLINNAVQIMVNFKSIYISLTLKHRACIVYVSVRRTKTPTKSF